MIHKYLLPMVLFVILIAPAIVFAQTTNSKSTQKTSTTQSTKTSVNVSSPPKKSLKSSIDSSKKTNPKLSMTKTTLKKSTEKDTSVSKSSKSSVNKVTQIKNDKLIVYQMMFHLWGNKNTTNKMNGSAEENGVTKFKDVNDLALKKLKEFGYSHLYMTGLIEHATMEDLTTLGIPKDHPDVVKGRCGSPFAIKDYYDVNPFFATNPKKRMDEFEAMLERVHKNGLKMVMDCVPNHLARVYHSDMKPVNIKDFGEDDDRTKSFAPYNNFYYLPNTQFQIPQGVVSPVKVDAPYIERPAKVSGNDVFSQKPTIDDWFETAKLNYGVDILNGRKTNFTPIPTTWIKMVGVLKYWAAKGVDGFRCDMAEMVPVEFWKYATTEVKKDYPNTIFIAEIYNPREYHNYIKVGGFDYLYDKVGLYDALRRLVEQKPEATVEDITRVWQNESNDISQNMLRFLENHDEVRINTPAFAKGDPFAVIPAMVVTATLHTGPLMIYFGQEVGESADDQEGFNQADDRTTMFDFWGVKAHQAWMNNGKFDGGQLSSNQKYLREFYGDLLKFVNGSDAVKNGEFYDLQYVQGEGYDRKKVYSYVRHTGKQKLLFVCNFNHTQEQNINLNIPEGAWNAMGFDMKTPKILKGKFNQKTQLTADPEKAISLKISPNSVVIYEILEKK
ncbi:alpha-amylase family glycosyl hydrolase [Arcicella sp. LKC2W]|uniref:alpha-amylase family glycosyl hydrolase n=1 Tax=Arcicella sp. LKC2W TaxID=2984198 RepID=UPI002B203B89|nr:alpha-amylase family glycosyl hydrolase [Arcicella sp. LKC2W]MEA5458431.1 alpha-amylase family glycosyl hydrolase [Arcicella sp. LKC2W]